MKEKFIDEIIWLDYWSTPLVKRQDDLTIVQRRVLLEGSVELHKKMNEVKK